MKKKQTHREPTLFIVGNPERKDEIRHILEDEWGGVNNNNYLYEYDKLAYFISTSGSVNCTSLKADYFKKAVSNGWMKEYKLPEKPKFKPFDRVVVKAAKGCTWKAAFYSHENLKHHIMTNSYEYEYCLPFNKDTARLIGTTDEWEGGAE